MLKKSLFYLVILLSMACTATKKPMTTKPTKTVPKVLTAIIELQAADHGHKTIVKLVNVVSAGGHVKIIPDESANFEFRFVDSQSHTLASVYKRINLTKVYEYVDDNGQLAKKVMDGEPVVVPIRTNYQSEMKKLMVYQMMKENFEPIVTFSLTENN